MAIRVKNRLKVLRAERDWTQAQLALELDVSRQIVNAIETDKFDPSLPLAFRIADLFDLSIETCSGLTERNIADVAAPVALVAYLLTCR